MKKVLLMFAFIATLLVGSIGTAGAQVNYTVYDGTNTSSYVPVYGLYCDAYLKCEYVIPADHLTAINGSTISALKFYSTTASADWGIANFRVFLKEVASPTISSYSGYADATEVYMGSLSISGNEMVVNFTTNYTYNGGNLLIGFYNETSGDYVGASFYGQTIQNSCVQGYSYSSLSGVTTNQRNFIPKTTFTVDELHGCLTPTNLAVSDITPYGATVTWTPGNTETAWVVKFNDNEYPVSGTPSYTVTGLTPETDYVASVKAVCGDTEESEYTTPGVLFTTLPTCPAPTGVTVSNITSTSADVAWTENVPASAWTIDYNGTEIPADSNPFTLTGLTPATNYTVKVKANCAADDESDWSATSTFTTECETFMVTETTPYFQGFDSTTFPPTCWSRNHTAGTATNTWIRSTSTVHQGAGAAQLQDQNVGNRNDLVTGLLNIPAANTYQVDFWMYRSTYSYSLKPNEGVKVWVNTTPDTVGATEIMYIHREYTLAPAEPATGWYEYSAIIPTSGDMYVIFQGISEYGTASYIDDITVNKAPTCLKPIDVTVSNITTTSADIAWTNGGSENAWIIDANGTEYPANDNPFTLTGLNPSTRYTVKVKAVCSEDDESDWSTEVSFRTECAAVALPFYESFEDGEFGCWTTEATSTSYNWNVSNGSITDYTSLSPADGSYVAYMNSHTRDKSAKLISPVLNLAGVNAPELSFQYLNHAWGSDQNILKVYYRTDATAAWTLLDTFAVDVTAWTEEVISLPNATATYQIAFEAVIDYGYNIVLDAISIIGVSCPAPTNVVVANETENSAEVSWTAGGEETAWNIRYRAITEPTLVYDFEDATMAGWTTLNTDGDTIVFVHSSANITGYDYSEYGHNGSAGFAVSNSFIDDMGEVDVDQYLVTVAPITVGSTTEMTFHYDYGNDSYPDYFEAGVFTQDPTDATNFQSLWNSQGRNGATAAATAVRHAERSRFNNWREVTVDLSTFAGQQVWIAFHHEDYDNYELWLDDVTIGDAPGEWIVVNGVTNPYTLTGLDANTTYEVQVQAACSEEDASNWTASVEFTTLEEQVEPCDAPTNVTVEANTVTWTSDAENFNLSYEIAGETTTVEVAGNTYTFEGLEDSTVVTVMVQAICDEENVSEWSEAVEFVYANVGINNYSINANVYPNPAHDVVNVECATIGANLNVYDMFGKVVMNTTISSERTELNFSNVAPGVYMIRIADNNAMTTVKVIKK